MIAVPALLGYLAGGISFGLGMISKSISEPLCPHHSRNHPISERDRKVYQVMQKCVMGGMIFSSIVAGIHAGHFVQLFHENAPNTELARFASGVAVPVFGVFSAIGGMLSGKISAQLHRHPREVMK